MNVSVSTDTARARITFAVSWEGTPDPDVAAELAASLSPEPGSFAGAVLSRALAQLGGDLTVSPEVAGAVVSLHVDSPARRT